MTTDPTSPLLRLHGEPGLRLTPHAPWHPLERKDAAWLAVLVADGPTSRDLLAGWLWPQAPLKTANVSLRQRVFRLRRRIGHELISFSTTLTLAVPLPHDADTEWLTGIDYSDTPAFAEWLRVLRERQRARRLDALAAVAARHEAAGELARAIELTQALLAEDPLSEHAHRRLMRLHYLRGDRAAAVAAFEQVERRLKDELGLSPSPETLALLSTVEASAPPRPMPRRPVPAALCLPPRMVDRAAELGALAQAWSVGRVFHVTGEAGMGKTRLLHEHCRLFPAALRVAARPGDDGVPFSLTTRLLRALRERNLLDLSGSPGDALAAVLPELGRPAVGHATPPSMLAAAMRDALTRAADAGLAGLVIDDLQFCDAASLDMLRALALDDTLARVRLGLARRPADPNAAADGLRAALEDAQLLHPVALRPLHAAGLQELVASLDLPEVDAAALGPLLWRHCGGNPLFALETLREMVMQGHGGDGTLPEPATVGALIDRRLQRLSHDALALARVAALGGEDFDIALAEQVLGQPALRLADAWAELEAAQVLDGTRFAHDLIRDAVLRSIPQAIAQHVHGGIAACLAARKAEAASCARHWQAAGRWVEAACAWKAAARRATDLGRRDEECRCLALAADAFEQAGDAAEALDARIARTASLVAMAGTDAALAWLDDLRARAHDPPAVAAVLTRRGYVMLWAGRFAAAADAVREALALPGVGTRVRVEATVVLARAESALGRSVAVLPVLQSLAPEVEGLQDDQLTLQFLGALTQVQQYANRRRDALRASHAHGALARRLGQQAELREALSGEVIAELALGGLHRAIDAARALQALERGLEEQDAARWVHDAALGWALQAAGRYDEALPLLETALGHLKSLLPGTGFTANATLFLADTMLGLGRPERAQHLLAACPPDLPGFVQARWAWTLARARRDDDHGPPPPAERAALEQVLPLTSGDSGLPMRLLLQADLSRHLPGDEAQALCARIADEAQRAESPVLELIAQLRAVQALLRQSRDEQAASLAAQVATRLSGVAGAALHPPQAWWICALAAHRVGDQSAVAAALDAGRQWIEQDALPHVPDAFRHGFLHRHAVHRQLLAWSARPDGPPPGRVAR